MDRLVNSSTEPSGDESDGAWRLIYTSYIQSPAWRNKRREFIADRNPNRCAGCSCKWGEYGELHHQSYERFGNEDLDDLIQLCTRCHVEVHRVHRAGNLGLPEATQLALAEIVLRNAVTGEGINTVVVLPTVSPVEKRRRKSSQQKAFEARPAPRNKPWRKPAPGSRDILGSGLSSSDWMRLYGQVE